MLFVAFMGSHAHRVFLSWYPLLPKFLAYILQSQIYRSTECWRLEGISGCHVVQTLSTPAGTSRTGCLQSWISPGSVPNTSPLLWHRRGGEILNLFREICCYMADSSALQMVMLRLLRTLVLCMGSLSQMYPKPWRWACELITDAMSYNQTDLPKFKAVLR